MIEGTKAKDSAGNEWTVWNTQWSGSIQNHPKVMVLAYSAVGEVKVFPAEQLNPVTEETGE